MAHPKFSDASATEGTRDGLVYMAELKLYPRAQLVAQAVEEYGLADVQDLLC